MNRARRKSVVRTLTPAGWIVAIGLVVAVCLLVLGRPLLAMCVLGVMALAVAEKRGG